VPLARSLIQVWRHAEVLAYMYIVQAYSLAIQSPATAHCGPVISYVTCSDRSVASVSLSVLQSLILLLVVLRLDYGSATLAGMPQRNWFRCRRMYDHVTPLLYDLHWLRVSACCTSVLLSAWNCSATPC